MTITRVCYNGCGKVIYSAHHPAVIFCSPACKDAAELRVSQIGGGCNIEACFTTNPICQSCQMIASRCSCPKLGVQEAVEQEQAPLPQKARCKFAGHVLITEVAPRPKNPVAHCTAYGRIPLWDGDRAGRYLERIQLEMRAEASRRVREWPFCPIQGTNVEFVTLLRGDHITAYFKCWECSK